MDYDIRHGRTYMYFKGEPLYPFGYGLSYTTFRYSRLQLSAARLGKTDTLTVSVDVKNTGGRKGDEVVQLYVSHLDSKVERAGKELRGFKRITLRPDETRTVTLPVKAQDLAYWDEKQNRWVVEADRVKFMVGASSADTRLESTISVGQ
jgi:beta-glucosidase